MFKKFVIVHDERYMAPMGWVDNARLAYRFTSDAAARRFLVRQFAASGATLFQSATLLTNYQVKKLNLT
jgi:hypothetical protein